MTKNKSTSQTAMFETMGIRQPHFSKNSDRSMGPKQPLKPGTTVGPKQPQAPSLPNPPVKK